MRIGLDIRHLGGSSTGVANYTLNVVRSVVRLAPEVSYMGFGLLGWTAFDAGSVARGEDTGAVVHAGPGMTAVKRGINRIANYGGLRRGRRVLRVVRQAQFVASVGWQRLDIFHAFNFRPLSDSGAPTLPVIYDLSTFRYPEFHPSDRVRWLAPLGQIIERAPLVQTISEFSKREIVHYFGYPSDRIFVAPPAASPAFSPRGEGATQAELALFDLNYGGFFLTVGTLEPRKNVRTLVAAYARLPTSIRARSPLVIAGGEGWGDLDLPRDVEALLAEGSLRFLRAITNEQLRSLYEGARLLLMPSLYEGFGMPVVEALACGTAVAFSAGTAMEEIASGVGQAVPAEDVDAWTDVLHGAMEAHDLADPLQRTVRIARAGEFDWGRSADLVLQAYRRMATGTYRGG